MSVATVEREKEILHELSDTWEDTPGILGFLSTVDHKRIGIRYLVTASVVFALAGLLALLIRVQLATPDEQIVAPAWYNQIFSTHGVAMIYFFAAPIYAGFSNYLVPLFVGTRDMAFPRLNALSYWVFLCSALFLLASIVLGQAPNTGWFSYVPLAGDQYSTGLNVDFFALALIFLTVSTTAGAVNFVATIFRLRAPGMSVGRLPLYLWSTLASSASILFSLPSLTAALVFLVLDRRFGTHFYDVSAGGQPILWQHLFWMFGHPWVYVIVLPGFGIASMIIPTFCRRRVVGYALLAFSSISVAILGFGVWMHHMFASGLPTSAMSFFSAASMTISVPSALAVFAWLATIWYGKPRLDTPFLFIVGFLVMFVIGGLNGVVLGVMPFDWQVTDTYFVVAHLHYVLIGLIVFPVLAGLYYWFPKMSGRMLAEGTGRWVFWLLFVGANVAFFPMHWAGILGMPRRVYTYSAGLGWTLPNFLSTIGAFLMAAGFIVLLVSVIRSLKHGVPAEDNPWGASSLEWATSSPPPPHNFRAIPTVHSPDPLWDDAPESDPRKIDDPSRLVAGEGHMVMITSVLDAKPQSITEMVGPSIWPFVLSLSLTIVFVGLLVGSMWTWGAGLVAVLVSVSGWVWPSQATEAA